MNKICPSCKQIYSNETQFCTKNGKKLSSYNPEIKSETLKLSVISPIVIIIILFMINLIPHAMKWTASNCDVTLAGISFPDNEATKDAIKEIFNAFSDIFSEQAAQTKNDPANKEKSSNDIILHLTVQNNNPLPIHILGLNFNLTINDNRFGSAIYNKHFQINSWEIKTIQLPLSVSLTSMFTSTGDIFFSQKLTYRAIGQIKVKVLVASIQFPLDIKGINIPVM